MSPVTAPSGSRASASTGASIEPTPADRLRRAVTLLHRRMRQLGTDAGSLTLTQSSALASIVRRGPLTLGELAARENVAPPTVTKAVAALEAIGYVTRTTDPDDRRVARVSGTAAGRRYLEEVSSVRTAWLQDRLEGLSAGDRKRLLDAIDVLEELSAETTEGRP
jgi:DNA-binding MarR family transcriptional regulator